MSTPRTHHDNRSVDRLLARLAATQDGLVTRAQLRAVGLSETTIARRVAAGRGHRVHRGVYAVGHPALSPHGRLRAAALACGEDALLTAATAASEWALRATRQARVDILVNRNRTAPAGVRLHRTSVLDAQDIAEVDGLRVTSVARTMLEIAPRLDDAQLERLAHRADVLRCTTASPSPMCSGVCPGTAARRACAASRRTRRRPTRSFNEQRLASLCDRRRIPRPRFNTTVHGLEVDACFAAARLVVEVDCRWTHGPREFETDRRRDERLLRHGIRTLRVTDTRLERDPDGVADTLVALGAR